MTARWKTAALATSGALWLGSAATGCNAIIGLSDLPPATDGGEGGPVVDARTTDAHDAKARDASRDGGDARSSLDATAMSDVSRVDGGVDSTVTDAAHDAHDAAKLPTFVVSPTTVLFGDAGGKPGFVACGTIAPIEDVTVTNNGPIPLSWWTSLGQGAASPYKLSTSCTAAAPCTLSAGDAGTLAIHITAPSIAAEAGIATYTDTLTVFSAATQDNPTNVSLETASYGAVIAFSQTDLNFGAQPANQPDGGYPQPLQVENTGNAPFTGSLGTRPLGDGATDAAKAPPFAVTRIADAAVGDATITVAPSSGTSFAVSFDPAGSATEAGASLILSSGAANALCGSLPRPVSLEGHGTTSPISVTSSINFNASVNGGVGVSCGTQTGPQNIVITNASMTVAAVTGLMLGENPSPFAVPATPISIPAATASGPGTATITVTPGLIPKSATPGESFSDTLTVTTNVAGDLPHIVSLVMTAAGVVLTAPSNLTFGSTLKGQNTNASLFLVNTGNLNLLGGQTSMTTSDATLFRWGPVPDFTPYKPLSEPATLTFTPAAAGTYMGSATLNVDGPFCSPPTPDGPPFDGSITVSLTGYGVGTSVLDRVLVPGQVTNGFGVPCGTLGSLGPPELLPFTLQNVMDHVQVNWSVALSGPDAAYFALATTSGGVIEGQEMPVTVLALPLGSTAALSATQAAYGLNATVTFTMMGSDKEIFSYPLFAVPQGGYLAWSTSGLDVPSGGSQGFSLLDWNYMPLPVTVTSGSPDFLVNVTGGSSARLAQPLIGAVADNHATLGMMTTITAAAPPASPMCGPVPTPLPVTLVAP